MSQMYKIIATVPIDDIGFVAVQELLKLKSYTKIARGDLASFHMGPFSQTGIDNVKTAFREAFAKATTESKRRCAFDVSPHTAPE